MVTEITRTPQMIVTREANGRVVRYRRTGVPIGDAAEFQRAGLALKTAVSLAERSHLGLLIDVRESPLRNDPKFEEASNVFVHRIGDGYARRAILVRTAVGKLQVQRLQRERGNEMRVFDDEVAAIAYLRGDSEK
jgi:hypothetical protein